jgi:hypothetical protein
MNGSFLDNFFDGEEPQQSQKCLSFDNSATVKGDTGVCCSMDDVQWGLCVGNRASGEAEIIKGSQSEFSAVIVLGCATPRTQPVEGSLWVNVMPELQSKHTMAPKLSNFFQAYRHMQRVLRVCLENNWRVLVYCSAGESCVVAFVVLHFMRLRCVQFEDALAYVTTRLNMSTSRFDDGNSNEFRQALLRYQARVFPTGVFGRRAPALPAFVPTTNNGMYVRLTDSPPYQSGFEPGGLVHCSASKSRFPKDVEGVGQDETDNQVHDSPK